MHIERLERDSTLKQLVSLSALGSQKSKKKTERLEGLRVARHSAVDSQQPMRTVGQRASLVLRISCKTQLESRSFPFAIAVTETVVCALLGSEIKSRHVDAMATYQPVSQSDPAASDLLLVDETFDSDRAKTDASLHHKEQDRIGQTRHHHHLLSQSASNASAKQSLFRVAADGSKIKTSQLPASATAPSDEAPSSSVPANGGKPNVTFRLSDEPESKVAQPDFLEHRDTKNKSLTTRETPNPGQGTESRPAAAFTANALCFNLIFRPGFSIDRKIKWAMATCAPPPMVRSVNATTPLIDHK